MHVVVAGGLGFIGSRIASRLLGEGHQVTILDSSVTSVVEGVKYVDEVVETPVRNLLECQPQEMVETPDCHHRKKPADP